MKRFLVLLVGTYLTLIISRAQGQIYFNTYVGGEVDAPVFAGCSGPGPLWKAALAITVPNSPTFTTYVGGLTTFRTAGTGAAAIANRYVVPLDVAVPVPPGTEVKVAMWVFDQQYSLADVAWFGAPYARTPEITLRVGGGLLPPSNLVGLQGLQLSLSGCPEPTPLVLFGGGAVILFVANSQCSSRRFEPRAKLKIRG